MADVQRRDDLLEDDLRHLAARCTEPQEAFRRSGLPEAEPSDLRSVVHDDVKSPPRMVRRVREGLERNRGEVRHERGFDALDCAREQQVVWT